MVHEKSLLAGSTCRQTFFTIEQNIHCQDMDDIDYNSLHCYTMDDNKVVAYS